MLKTDIKKTIRNRSSSTDKDIYIPIRKTLTTHIVRVRLESDYKITSSFLCKFNPIYSTSYSNVIIPTYVGVSSLMLVNVDIRCGMNWIEFA